jgi:hypothetical protein
MAVKKLVNLHEAAAKRVLQRTADRNGAEVYTKVRIADVLEIDHSGLDNTLYGYALKAHFDFVVVNEDNEPLFAVEYDGPGHGDDADTQERDHRKNVICKRLGLPLARVTAEHLTGRAGPDLDVLTWLIECWFGKRALEEVQASGQLPWDEPCDPMSFLTHPHIPGDFPLFISRRGAGRLWKLYDQGRVMQPFPKEISRWGPDGETDCLCFVQATADAYLVGRAGLYLQGFGVLSHESASELACIDLERALNSYLAGAGGTATRIATTKMIEAFAATDRPGFCSGPPGSCGLEIDLDALLEKTKERVHRPSA